MAISKALLEDLEKRRAAARVGGGEDKLEARRKKGVMTARDRLAALFQPGRRSRVNQLPPAEAIMGAHCCST